MLSHLDMRDNRRQRGSTTELGVKQSRRRSMRTLHTTMVLTIGLTTAALAAAQAPPAQGAAAGQRGGGGPAMTLTIDAWPDGDPIPAKYTQAVPNPVSPAMKWSNTPAGTQSFVLHFHDPDVAIEGTTN